MLAYLYIFIAVIIIAGIVITLATQAITNNYKVIEAQRNVYKTILWKNALIQNAKNISSGGLPALPIGVDGASYHTLPSWVYPETKNIYGFEYVYCPYGAVNTGTPTTTVKSSTSTSYSVQTLANYITAVDGTIRPYVISSATPPNGYNVLGFIISPFSTKSGTQPSCNNITFDTESQKYITDNGYVEAITKYDIEIYQKVSATGNNNYNYYENNVEGDNSSTGNTLLNNLSYVGASSGAGRVKITLPSGTSKIDNLFFGYTSTSNNNYINENLNKRELIIQGQSDKSSIISADTVKTLTFYNYKVYLKDVTLNSNVKLDMSNSDLLSQNSSLKQITFRNRSTFFIPEKQTVSTDLLTMYDSSVNLTTGSVLNVSGSNGLLLLLNSYLDINSGTLNLANTTYNGSIQLYDSNINGTNANINYTATGAHNLAFYVDETSKISLINGAVNISGYPVNGFGIRGKMTVKEGSVFTTSSGMTRLFFLLNNGELNLNNTNTTQLYGSNTADFRPGYTVYDEGGKYVSGTNSILTAKTACWNKSTNTPNTASSNILFIASATAVNGANSRPIPDNLTVTNSGAIVNPTATVNTPWVTQWTRAVNQSSWTCQM